MEKFKDITLDKVYEARERIANICIKTPLLRSNTLSKKWNKNIGLKLENLQPSGAFKLRGATNAILSLSETEKKAGVVTMSTGNHGKAVAFVAQQLGIKAVICISNLVPQVKIQAMEDLGAKVVVSGNNQDEATEAALSLQNEKGLRYISAFDDPMVIAGQATTALEILEQQPEVDTIIVPLSGGGLMSGIAFTIKSLKPSVRLVGVTNDTEPAMYTSIKAGHIVQVGESESIADAISGPIPMDNQYTFEICKRNVDDYKLVSDLEIARAMSFALLKERQVLEGGGAATLAFMMSTACKGLGKNIVAICSGNNVNMRQLLDISNENYAFIEENYK